jgi:hypothetical protein
MTEGMGLSAREFAEWHLESETYDPRTIGGGTLAVEANVPSTAATTNGAVSAANSTMANWPTYPSVESSLRMPR